MQFQILGPLRVTDGHEREIALGGAKPAALLAMLLLRANEVVAADRLIEDLWDGQPPATAAKTLQVHISRLRRALGDDGSISTSRGGYVLQAEPDQVDALRFQSLISEGRQALAEGSHARASARMRSALALWRGDALADFAYASFAQDAIARLEGLRTVAVESAVEAELALGRHTELIPELKSLVKRHPLSEHLHGQLMLALYRAGRQAEALGVYRAARRVLVDHLGIEPSAELRELERAILAHDDAVAAPSPQPQPRAPRQRAEKAARGTLVGYERELGALEDVLEQALVGLGRLALISGEPGVGKTRLADELSSVASARGAQVVWGRCSSDGGAPAYWPWIQILRALIADRDPRTLRAELGARLDDVAQLLPELRDQIPDLDGGARGEAEDARFRLFDATATLLIRGSAAQPLVLVVDDLHAADTSTLSLLQFVARAAIDAPILIVATYRDTQTALERGLSETLSELARTTDCLQLVLTGLSNDDTAHFVELTAGVTPMPLLAAAIHETSSGNPLFVSELVRLLRAEDRLHELDDDSALVLPRGVAQVIARRIDQLSDGCRGTLAAAAVIGREADMHVLERAGHASGDELLTHIEDAVAARVIEESGGTVRFSHDLVRHTLYASLGTTERRRLHAAVGEALEQLHGSHPEPVASELAHHFSEALPAGDASKAVRYLGLAGNRAADVSASHEAASWYERAVEIGKAHGADADTLCDLYLDLAEQRIIEADMRGGETAVAQAEALAGPAPDRKRAGRLTLARAQLFLFDTDVFDEAQIYDTIALFHEIGDPLGEARAWSALVTLSCGRSARHTEGEAAQRMLECAKRGGSKALIGQAIRGMGSSLATGSTPVSEAIPRVRALYEEAADATIRARLLVCLAVLEAARGRFDTARATMAESRATAPRSEREMLECTWRSYGVRIELLAGNIHRAEEIATELCSAYRVQGLGAFLASELMFLVDALVPQGRFEEALAALEEAAPLTADDDVDALFRQARSWARLELARGDLDAAEVAARTAVRHVQGIQSSDEGAETRLVLARVLLAAGQEAEAREVAAEALAISDARENVVLAQQARELAGAAESVAAA